MIDLLAYDVGMLINLGYYLNCLFSNISNRIFEDL